MGKIIAHCDKHRGGLKRLPSFLWMSISLHFNSTCFLARMFAKFLVMSSHLVCGWVQIEASQYKVSEDLLGSIAETPHWKNLFPAENTRWSCLGCSLIYLHRNGAFMTISRGFQFYTAMRYSPGTCQPGHTQPRWRRWCWVAKPSTRRNDLTELLKRSSLPKPVNRGAGWLVGWLARWLTGRDEAKQPRALTTCLFLCTFLVKQIILPGGANSRIILFTWSRS